MAVAVLQENPGNLKKEQLLLQKSIVFTMAVILLLWLVKSLEMAFFGDLSHFGLYPRSLHGAVGIFTSPLIHGGYQHLIANTLSWLLLGLFFFFFYDRIAVKIVLVLYLLTGLLVWVFARDAYHIGFSGVLFGVASFMLISGFVRKNVSALVLSFSVLILFGGMFYGVLPQGGNISWESHLMGMVAGLVLAIVYRKQYAGMVDWKLNFELNPLTDDEDEPSGDWEDRANCDLPDVACRYTFKEESKTSDIYIYRYPEDKTKEV